MGCMCVKERESSCLSLDSGLDSFCAAVRVNLAVLILTLCSSHSQISQLKSQQDEVSKKRGSQQIQGGVKMLKADEVWTFPLAFIAPILLSPSFLTSSSSYPHPPSSFSSIPSNSQFKKYVAKLRTKGTEYKEKKTEVRMCVYIYMCVCVCLKDLTTTKMTLKEKE